MGVPRLVIFAQAAHWHWCMSVNASHCLAQHVLYDVECALCIYNRVTYSCTSMCTVLAQCIILSLVTSSPTFTVLFNSLYTSCPAPLRPHRISLLFWATTLSWCKVGLLLSSFSSTCPANHSCQALHNLDHCIYSHLAGNVHGCKITSFLRDPIL